jgi:hypothetical protein
MKRKTFKRKSIKQKLFKRKTIKIKTIKHKTKITKQKNKKMAGGSVLGYGVDGCVIDSVSCNNIEMSENNIIAKIFKKDININKELQEKLIGIDPSGERFIHYQFCDDPKFNNTADIVECKSRVNSELNTSLIGFMPLLKPLSNPKEMSKIQYRYLKRSIEMLHENLISHGDLDGNIMISRMDNLPRIIDWEHANEHADNIDFRIDNDVFLREFKCKRI